MAIVVQKYGGSSVADIDKVRAVAQKIAERKRKGFDLVVVVSAMGDTTDDLLALAHRVSEAPPRRELDMLLTAGERISMALLSMALHRLGVEAISFTGSQSGIITNDSHSNAQIIAVRPVRIREELERGRVVIVAGYQGVSLQREVTTLGRGGSDTTAVALAAALGAVACEIYSDVDGVFSSDPRVVPQARQLREVAYEEMQELAGAGARVLNAQAVEFARRAGIVIDARSTFSNGQGTRVQAAPPHASRVTGVAGERDIALLSLEGAALQRLDELCALLDACGLAAWQLSCETGAARLLLPLANLHDREGLEKELASRFSGDAQLRLGLAAVSAVGTGINADHANLRRALAAFRSEVPVFGVSSTPLRLTFLVPAECLEEGMRRLHRVLVEIDPSP